MEKQKLEEKERELLSQRKALPESEKEKLRDLQFEYQLEQILPSYQRDTVLKYDEAIWKMFSGMLNASLNHKQQVDSELDVMERNPNLVRGKSSWTADQISTYVSDTKKKSIDELEMLIGLATEFITNVDHLTAACKLLNSFKQYPALIQMGKHAQSILKEMVMLKIIYEEKTKELREERDQLPPSVSENEKTLELAKELEILALQVSSKSQHELRSMILAIADLMIDAARVEKMYDVVRDQSVLVFKMTLTYAKFEEVRTLVDEKDWPDIRKKLLDYVVGYNATLPGSAITIKEQMELLLREGLANEATRLLPDPPLPSQYDYADKAAQYVKMLEILWFETERISSDGLSILLPLIEEFAKKEFQQQRTDTMDHLLDGVQGFYPDFIVDLYQTASDLLLSSLQGNVKQYKLYANFAAVVKRRFLEINKKSSWKAFISDVRTKNIRKKNLIRQLDVNDLK
mmetsp:Transcript_10827/g.17038  ORF Transcript_10827/g.17038 Transcript_10827/m.17038 type:complete len:460 (+) Transcript_10827:5253-6632(+)